MIGLFKVLSFKENNLISACSCMTEDVVGLFYLPPLARQATSNIQAESVFFGVLDDVSGFGALLVGFGDADFNGHFQYSISTDSSVTAGEDVNVGSISLTGHIHSAAAMATSDGKTVTGTTSGAEAGV